jgi:hypothetical protein
VLVRKLSLSWLKEGIIGEVSSDILLIKFIN